MIDRHISHLAHKDILTTDTYAMMLRHHNSLSTLQHNNQVTKNNTLTHLINYHIIYLLTIYLWHAWNKMGMFEPIRLFSLYSIQLLLLLSLCVYLSLWFVCIVNNIKRWLLITFINNVFEQDKYLWVIYHKEKSMDLFV